MKSVKKIVAIALSTITVLSFINVKTVQAKDNGVVNKYTLSTEVEKNLNDISNDKVDVLIVAEVEGKNLKIEVTNNNCDYSLYGFNINFKSKVNLILNDLSIRFDEESNTYTAQKRYIPHLAPNEKVIFEATLLNEISKDTADDLIYNITANYQKGQYKNINSIGKVKYEKVVIPNNYYLYQRENTDVNIERYEYNLENGLKTNYYKANVQIDTTKNFIHSYPFWIETEMNNLGLDAYKECVTEQIQDKEAIFAINATGFANNITEVDGIQYEKGTFSVPTFGPIGTNGNIDYIPYKSYKRTLNDGSIIEANGWSRATLVLRNDGLLRLVKNPKTYDESFGWNLSEVENGGFQWCTTYGPVLVENGINKATGYINNSRTCLTGIGQKTDDFNNFTIIVVDGSTDGKYGLNHYEFAELFKKEGCNVAYNLDGGGSSTMVFDGVVLNSPYDNNTNDYNQRKLFDCLYVEK